MAVKARCIFIASMDVEPDKEAIFNEVYDVEHIPLILKVPGVLSARRMQNVPLKLSIGGEVKTIIAEGEPRYSAIYELASADVLTSEAWTKAGAANELFTIRGGGHGNFSPDERTRIYATVRAFLARHGL